MKKQVMSIIIVLAMVLTLLPMSASADSWPFVPSEKNLTDGKIKSGWYLIYSHDMGTFRIDGSLVLPSRRARNTFYFEHLGDDKYYIYDSNGKYLAFEGNYSGNKPKEYANIVASKTACKWIVYTYNAGGYVEYKFAPLEDHGFDITTGVESCTATKDSKLYLTKSSNIHFRSRFTVVKAPDELIPQWWNNYITGGD